MRTAPDRPERLTIRLTTAEHAVLVDLATANELTLSEYARKLLTQGLRTRTRHPRTPAKK